MKWVVLTEAAVTLACFGLWYLIDNKARSRSQAAKAVYPFTGGFVMLGVTVVTAIGLAVHVIFRWW